MARMKWRRRVVAGVLGVLALSLALSACQSPRHTATTPTRTPAPLATDFASVDPAYIYDQLAYMTAHFQHREAGYDINLPPLTNGHDEFAAYWAGEMEKNLAGYAAAPINDTFQTPGWKNRPPSVAAFNVEVTVPGSTHPEQEVVIGCHYDGEAISTQSANDDASGCAIELGIGRALAVFWKSHHTAPARTLRFVIFDAEEQGLYGSSHYVNETINGDLGNVVAMFNEEQSGIAYPLRYLGKASNQPMPLDVFTSPLSDNDVYSGTAQLTQAQRAAITSFTSLQNQAIAPVFQRFQALGDGQAVFHADNGQPTTLPIFTQGDLANIQQQPDNIGSSDQLPFTFAGVPCVTYVGNATYYGRNPPQGSYPYDQPEDTVQLMNTFANGSAAEAPTLELSLALPGMLTTWSLSQPDILSSAPLDSRPVAAIGDIGQTVAGQPLALMAQIVSPDGQLQFAWDFGDGAHGSGPSVTHTYAKTGDYTLALTVTASGQSRTITKPLHVTAQPTSYVNPYQFGQLSGSPPSNPTAILPTPGT